MAPAHFACSIDIAVRKNEAGKHIKKADRDKAGANQIAHKMRTAFGNWTGKVIQDHANGSDKAQAGKGIEVLLFRTLLPKASVGTKVKTIE